MPARSSSSARPRGEETRAHILAAAETLFAARGYAETRLEDVAERVGVRRAALFYHFRDKRALHEAVLQEVFGGLLDRVRTAVAQATASIPEALESAVSTWVDYVWERPSTAQLLLRESGRQGQVSDALTRLARPFLELLHETFAEGRRQGVLQPITSDPLHFGSMIVGSTIFFVAGMPSFVPDLPFDPLSREQLEIHRRDALRVARRLLGLHGPRPVRA